MTGRRGVVLVLVGSLVLARVGLGAEGPRKLPVHRPSAITAETEPVRQMAVSGDGRWLVYVRGSADAGAGETDLYLRSADPGRVIPPEPRPGGDDPMSKSFPAISREGRWIAYVGTGHDVTGDIYLIDRESPDAEPRRLTGREAADGGPAFSPDGRTLYFHQTRPEWDGPRLVALDLTTKGPGVRDFSVTGSFPAVSPDGRYLAYVTHDRHRNGDIARLELSSGKLIRITDDPEPDLLPSWSPDGREVLFSRIDLDTDGDGALTPGDRARIFRADPAGNRSLTALTAGTVSALAPVRAGDRLLFISDRGGGANVWSLPPAGEVPDAPDARTQWAMAREMAGKVPPEPLLAALAADRVVKRFPDAGVAPAAGLAVGESFEAAGHIDAARRAYTAVVESYPSARPEADLARIGRTAITTRDAVAAAGNPEARAEALRTGLDRLSTHFSSSDPRVAARARIASARASCRLDCRQDAGSTPDPKLIADGIAVLEPVIESPDAAPALRAEALLVKADLYAQLGRPDRVRPLYEAVIDRYPDVEPWAAKAAERIVDAAADGTAGPTAVQQLRRVAERSWETRPILAVAALNRVGDLLDAADRPAEAKAAYREVLDRAGDAGEVPGTAAARLALAEILYREERFSQALSLYEAEIESRPYEDRIYNLARRGYIDKTVAAADYLYRLGEVLSARSKLKALIRYDSSIVPAHRGYIRCAATMGDIQPVLADYRKRMAEAPGDPVFIYAVALCLTYLDTEEALTEARGLLERAVSIDGQVPFYHQTLGYVLEMLEVVHGRSGTLELALSAYRRARFLTDAERYPGNAADLMLNLGNVAFALQRYADAFRYYVARLEADQPFGDPTAEILFYQRLGAAGFAGGEPRRTRAAFETALDRIDAQMAPKAASDVFDRLIRKANDALRTAATKDQADPVAERLAEAEAEIHQALYRITQPTQGVVTPPPSPEWKTYRTGVEGLIERQAALIPELTDKVARTEGVPASRQYGRQDAATTTHGRQDAATTIHQRQEAATTIHRTLTLMLKRVREALDRSERLVELKAETLDRLGLACQETGDWAAAAEAFNGAFDLNQRLGNTQNLARNRRSAAFCTYQHAGTQTGAERERLLSGAADGFSEAIALVREHGVPDRSPEPGGEGLVNIRMTVSLHATNTTAAAHGFSADQEIRLAEAFLVRIGIERGRLADAETAIAGQLAAYPPDETIAPADRYGVALLFHRGGLIAHARGDDATAFDRFRRSAELTLAMENRVSTTVNIMNMGRALAFGTWDGDREKAWTTLDQLARRTDRLLAGLEQKSPLASTAAQYQNAMGVYALSRPVPAGLDGAERAVIRLRYQAQAGLAFQRGLDLLGDPVPANDPQAAAAAGVLHLNLAAVARDLHEPDRVRDHLESALKLADRANDPGLKWRALAGLGRPEDALKVLDGLTVVEAGCGAGEIVATFAPLVADRVRDGAVADAFALAERIAEIERFHRTASWIVPAADRDRATVRDIYPRIERIIRLRAEAEAADGERRTWLEDRVETETEILAEQAGGWPAGDGLPEALRIHPPGPDRDSAIILLGLALDAQAAAESGREGLAKTMRDRYRTRLADALAERDPASPPGLMGLFGPVPVSPEAVMAVLPPEAALVRPVGVGTPHAVTFILTAAEIRAEPGIPDALPPDTRYLAGESVDGITVPDGAARATSATHLVRAVASRKPFREVLMSIPPVETPPDGYTLAPSGEDPFDVDGPVHTLLVRDPVTEAVTVPTRAGETPERFPGVRTESGRYRRLDRLLSELAGRSRHGGIALALLPGAKSAKSADGISHLAGLFGLPTAVLPAGDPSSPDPERFLSAYLDGDAVTAAGDAWVVLGDSGLTPAAAAELAQRRFAKTVRAGRADYKAGRWEAALIQFDGAIRVADRVPALAKYLPALYGLARESAHRSGKLERALTYATALAELLGGSAPDSQAHAEAVLREGLLLAKLERYDRAVPRLERAVAVLESLDLPAETASALSSLGIVLENATEYDRALSRFQSAADVAESSAGDALLAQQESNIGRIHDLRMSQYAVAITHYGRAKAAFERAGDPAGVVQSIIDIGRCRRLLGNFAEAEARFAQAAEALPNLENNGRLSVTVTIEQANLAWYTARYETAFKLQREAQRQAEAIGWPLGRVITRNTAGLIWWTLGDHERALSELDGGLEIARDLKARDDEVATTLNNIGQVLRDMGRYREAVEHFEAALDIDTRIGSKWAIAHDHRNLGMTRLRTGDFAGAADLLDQAVAGATAIGNRINAARSLVALGEAAAGTGNRDRAERAYTEALDLSREMALREVEWRALYGLGRLRLEMDDREGALDRLNTAVSVIEGMRAEIRIDGLKSGFIANKLDVYEALVGLLVKMDRPIAAFEAAERSRARSFIDLLGNQRLRLGRSVDAALYGEMTALEARIAEHEALVAQSTDPTARKTYEETLARLRRDYETLMIEIQSEAPQLAATVTVSPIDAETLTDLLPPDVALVSWYLLPDTVLAWVIRAEGIELVRIPADRAALGEEILVFRRAIQNLEPVETLSQRLHDRLMSPVLPRLDGASVVGMVPHKSLHYLSFAALSDAEAYLVDRFPLFYLPTTSLLEYTFSRRRADRNTKVLAIGAPDLGDPALELPFSEYEVGAIKWRFPEVTILTGERATEAWVVENISRFGIIHIASHGELDSINPLFSAVKLARADEYDGNLEAAEVFGLDINADMVVLSACQTGLGKVSAGDDVIGLNRAFFYAGTHTIVSSLWRVSDVSTAMLMKQFYRSYGRADKAESLRRAIAHVRTRYPHPGYWAAFTLAGDYF